MWNPEQRRRLAFEQKLVERKMPQFSFYDLTDNTYIFGWARTTSGCSYGVWVGLSPRHPYSKPTLCITSPNPLLKYNGESVNAQGTSHAFHTYSNNGGCVKICYSGSWNSTHTCLIVLLKAFLWLEAYEAHLRTGRNLADFLC